MARALLTLCVAVLACAGAAAGSSTAGDRSVTLTMDDGVELACGYRPAPKPPAPGLVLFHGIGGRHEDLDDVAQAFNGGNYATLACDARGQGASGGFFDLDGFRTVDDARAQLDWLASQPGVQKPIGAWGISLGGGAVLNSAAAGVPWGAIETVETWSDLYSALAPSDLAKSGAIGLFSLDVPEDKRPPEFTNALQDALSGQNRAYVLKYAGARSSLQRASAITVPTFLFQGRRDFVFDISQATRLYARLPGPRRLYIGDFGHSPSTFPGADVTYVLTEGVAWFDRYLKHAASTVQAPIVLATDPWNRSPVSYTSLPATRRVSFTWRRGSTIGAHGKVVRSARLPRAKLETFGAPVVRARLSGTFSHVVAVVTTADGTIVSEGGTAARLASRPRWISIPLISDATRLRGKRLTLTIAGTSTAQDPANALYLVDVGETQRLRVGRVTLTLPVLRKPISR